MTVGFKNGNFFALSEETDPGSSGDSYKQFSINSAGEFRLGVDDNDSDAFKISQGSALGTNDTFVMASNGIRTLPLQPAFWAYQATTANNVTGNGTTYSLGASVALTQVIDRNNDFDPGDGAGTAATFTAPTTGIYNIGMQSRFIGISGTPTSANFIINSTTYDLPSFEYDPNNVRNGITFISFSHNVLVPLASSETVTFQVSMTGVGADTVDIGGLQGSDYYTAVWGYLEM